MGASKYFFLFYLVLFGSCKGLSDRRIVGRYFLVAVDYENSQTCLSYEIGNDESFVGVIEPMIFAVGYDNRFIILKQHPVKLIPQSSVDKSITNYYIVTIPAKYKDIPNDKDVYGPFDERQFFAKRKELGVSSLIKFTISIDE